MLVQFPQMLILDGAYDFKVSLHSTRQTHAPLMTTPAPNGRVFIRIYLHNKQERTDNLSSTEHVFVSVFHTNLIPYQRYVT